jgi:hypothetical protein
MTAEADAPPSLIIAHSILVDLVPKMARLWWRVGCRVRCPTILGLPASLSAGRLPLTWSAKTCSLDAVSGNDEIAADRRGWADRDAADGERSLWVR